MDMNGIQTVSTTLDANADEVDVIPTRGIAEYLSFLARSVVNHPHFRVCGPSEGYRCKMTYSLYPSYTTSPLAMPDVNRLSDVVHRFLSMSVDGDALCPTAARWIYEAHPRFFFEVCVKVSRKKEYMVKLVVFNARRSPASSQPGSEPSDVFTEWRACGEDARFLAFIDEHFEGNVAAVIAHVGMEKKADKEDRYIPLRSTVEREEGKGKGEQETVRSGTFTSELSVSIVEWTPNGVPFLLSADSFCEVNHRMEDEMYFETLRMLRLSPPLNGSGSEVRVDPPRRVFISGRDVNSVVKTYDMYYAQVTAVTTCPRVYEDVQLNGLGAVCAFSRKDEIWKHLRYFRTGEWPKDVNCGVDGDDDDDDSETREYPNQTSLPSQVLITAGRHGLHPSTCFEFVQFASHSAASQEGSGGSDARGSLEDLVYVSCNVESLSRDLFILKEGFYVAAVRTFDFFPGTDYVMTMLHLKPLALLGSSRKHHTGLLVLPIGPPGIGKSTCGRFLAETLRNEGCNGSEGVEDGCDIQMKTSQDNYAKSSTRRGRCTLSSGQSKDDMGMQLAPLKKQRLSPTTTTTRTTTTQSLQSKANPKNVRNASKKPFIPRHFATIRPSWVARCVERDEVFRQCKSSGMSLKQSKQRTHETLLNALNTLRFTEEQERKNETSASSQMPESVFPVPPPRVVLYLDSTNGSREGRELYHQTWNGLLSLDVFFTLPLRSNDAEEVEVNLLKRTCRRRNHPSFPMEEAAQREKIATIIRALNEAVDESSGGSGDGDGKSSMDDAMKGRTTASICIQNGRSAKETCERMVMHVVAALVFSISDILSLKGDDAKDSSSWPIVNDALALMEVASSSSSS